MGDGGELDDPEGADIDKAKFEHDTLVVQVVVYQALEQLLSMYVVNSTKTLKLIPIFLHFFRRLYAPVLDHVTPAPTLAKLPL
jgi:hypothetical protein